MRRNSKSEVIESNENMILVAIPIDDKTKLTPTSLAHFGAEIRSTVRGKYGTWFWEDEVTKSDQRFGLARGVTDDYFNNYRHNVERTTLCRTECPGCGRVEDYESDTLQVEQNFIKELITEGWRYGKSEALNGIGLFCPECFKNKDNPKYWE